MNCGHPQSAQRMTIVVVRGYRCKRTYCNDCKSAYQRARTALKRAFWRLATARWVHG
jgi:hypothetical protein